MLEQVNTDSLPWSGRHIQRNKWLIRLGVLMMLALRAVSRFLPDIIADSRPENRVSCSSQRTLHANVAHMQLIQHLSPHLPRNYNSVAFEYDAIVHRQLIPVLEIRFGVIWTFLWSIYPSILYLSLKTIHFGIFICKFYDLFYFIFLP